jgi:hypothetical protein
MLFKRSLGRLALVSSLCGATVCVAQSQPSTIPYLGQLSFDTGAPYSGVVDVTVAAYAGAATAEPIWGPHTISGVEVEDGLLSVLLGAPPTAPIGDGVLDRAEVWLGFSIGSTPLAGRQRLHAVPYARFASDAVRLGGVAASQFQQAGAPASFASLTVGGVTLDGSGSARVSADSSACNAQKAGAIRFQGGVFEGCNGTAWAPLGAVAPCAGDTAAPSGYAVSIPTPPGGDNVLTFTYSGGEVGATLGYSIVSSGGGSVTGQFVLSAAAGSSTANVGALGNGTLTLTATLTDVCNNTGAQVTASSTKGSTPNVLVPGNTTLEVERSGYRARCSAWQGTLCTYPELKPSAAYNDCGSPFMVNAWYWIWNQEGAHQKFCAIATGSPATDTAVQASVSNVPYNYFHGNSSGFSGIQCARNPGIANVGSAFWTFSAYGHNGTTYTGNFFMHIDCSGW